ncbi:MAG: CZB domain-containing protein [Candidatus Calescibacterium sp.]|nr:CZB domain-containing protein [Candidatus Calescibacterium sp.]MDW8086756.1 CZB domain-containing protein [Candidatus Calescibacterium sp.]
MNNGEANGNEIKSNIDKAIAAHNLWKARFKEAIQNKKIDFSVDFVRSDRNCDFGKWLYSVNDISEYYRKVKELHAEFHKTAARVIEYINQGRVDEAEKMLSVSGDFSQASARLTKAMMEWKDSIR